MSTEAKKEGESIAWTSKQSERRHVCGVAVADPRCRRGAGAERRNGRRACSVRSDSFDPIGGSSGDIGKTEVSKGSRQRLSLASERTNEPRSAAAAAAAAARLAMATYSDLQRQHGVGSRSGASLGTARIPTKSKAEEGAACEHFADLSQSELKRIIRRYAVGIRWGKKVWQGLVEEEQMESDLDGYPAANNLKKRKVSVDEREGGARKLQISSS